jgi:hypothetical protein
MTRTLTNLALKSLFGVITGMTLFAHQAISAPIAGPKGILVVPLDNSQVVQVRAARAYRGGSVHRGAAVHRRATVYRGGAVVRRGAVAVGGRYYGGSCDPYYQNCGGGSYSGGIYRGGAVVRGGAVIRGGAVVRRGYRGAHVSHHRGGGRRR